MSPFRRRLGASSAWAAAVLVVTFALLPLWYMLVMSLDPDPVGGGASLWPTRVTLDNYGVLTSPAFGFYPALRHSLMVTVATTAVSLAVALPSAYALGRLTVHRQGLILGAMLALAFFPGVVLVPALSRTFSALGWLDTLGGIGLAQLSFTVPLALWFLTYAFRAVPADVEEAARVDGAGTLARMVWVILPIARPGVIGTLAIVYVASWNDFLFSSTLNRSPRSETLAVMITLLPSLGFLGGQMAAGVLMCLPVALVLAVLVRWLGRRSAAAT